MANAKKHRSKSIVETVSDRGYIGKKEVDGVKISIPGVTKKRDKNIKEKKQERSLEEGLL